MIDSFEYQARQKVAILGDRFISFLDKGSGEPIIFLHGIPTWGYLWNEIGEELSKDYRVLIPDLPGFGYSDKSDRFDRSIDQQARYINQWMDNLRIPKAVVVGHDIGGGIAMRLAAFFPNRVSRLCLMNSVCYDSWPIESMLQLGHPNVDRILSAETAALLLKRTLNHAFFTSPHTDFIDALIQPYRTEVGKLSLIRNASALNTSQTTELTQHLSGIIAPTLILWGEEDPFQLVKYGAWLERDIPNSIFRSFPQAGHFLMVDQPQLVVESLRNFMKLISSARRFVAA